MAEVLPISTLPLVPDTLPALKVRYYFGDAAPAVYCYARMYVLEKQLLLNLRAFEKNPPEGSRIAFCLLPPAGAAQALCLGPQSARLAALPTGTAAIGPQDLESLPGTTLEPAFFAGEDEQGWYWGANAALPFPYGEGSMVRAAVYKYGMGGGSLGASVPLEDVCIRPEGMAAFVATGIG